MSRLSAFTPGRSMCTHTSLPRRKASIGITPPVFCGRPDSRLKSVSRSRNGSVWIIMALLLTLAGPTIGPGITQHNICSYVECQAVIMLTGIHLGCHHRAMARNASSRGQRAALQRSTLDSWLGAQLSANTRAAYRLDLEAFGNWCALEGS